ncbi:unnamed protein product [Protopolystoma xenopodis]|uniref:Uncharacterized protein n=1 Tax=Protopolystoma xenopodis TaxID=117903 RepID=A0A3S5BGD5_9PLAT|nr:unnamed protein product [Protopolystoma xenopodis]
MHQFSPALPYRIHREHSNSGVSTSLACTPMLPSLSGDLGCGSPAGSVASGSPLLGIGFSGSGSSHSISASGVLKGHSPASREQSTFGQGSLGDASSGMSGCASATAPDCLDTPHVWPGLQVQRLLIGLMLVALDTARRCPGPRFNQALDEYLSMRRLKELVIVSPISRQCFSLFHALFVMSTSGGPARLCWLFSFGICLKQHVASS